jgi:hypothetical protein
MKMKVLSEIIILQFVCMRFHLWISSDFPMNVRLIKLVDSNIIASATNAKTKNKIFRLINLQNPINIFEELSIEPLQSSFK